MTTPTTDSTAPDSPSSPSSPAPLPTFTAPVRAPGLRMNPLTRLTTTPSTPTPDQDSDAGYDDPVDHDASPSSGTRSGSDQGEGVKVKIDRNVLTEVLRGFVMAASEAAHNVFARTDEERAAGVWLADPDDQRAIADPLAKIAGRKAGPVAPNADAADLIAAGLGVAMYAAKSIRKHLAIRRAARNLGDTLPDFVEHPA